MLLHTAQIPSLFSSFQEPLSVLKLLETLPSHYGIEGLSDEKRLSYWRLLTLQNFYESVIPIAKREPLYDVLISNMSYESLQIERGYAAFNAYLLQKEIPEWNADILEKGAALLDFEKNEPWSSFPNMAYHVELGLLMGWLGYVRKDEILKLKAQKLAHWHLNLLGKNFYPSTAFFRPDEEGTLDTTLLGHWVLFKTIGSLCHDPQLLYAAKRVAHFPREEMSTPAFTLLKGFYRFLSQKGLEEEEEEPFELPLKIEDPSCSFLGLRCPQHDLHLTLIGSHVGMGSFSASDVSLLTFGPHSGSLDQMEAFGIDSLIPLRAKRARDFKAQLEDEALSLGGIIGIAGESRELFKWMKVEMEYKQEALHLDFKLLAPHQENPLTFNFYFKSKRCLVGGIEKLAAHPLESYTGPVQNLTFIGREGVLSLIALQHGGSMTLRALEGRRYFLGADYVVSFAVSKEIMEYQFKIKSQRVQKSHN